MTKTNTESENIELNRTGLPPIRFTGREIGSGSTRTNDSTRWTSVSIYRSQGGRWLASVASFSCWEDEQDHHRAAAFETALGLVDWLTADNDGRLGRASQQACEEASKADPDFREAYVEVID